MTLQPSRDRTDGRSDRPIGMIVTIVLIALVLALGVFWLIAARGDDDAQDTTGAGVVPSDILADPSAYRGKDVEVVSPVGDIVPPAGFTLGDLLVVGIPNGQVQQAKQEDWSLTAWGKVQDFDPAVIERAVGQPVDSEVVASFQGKPMLVATRVAAGEGD